MLRSQRYYKPPHLGPLSFGIGICPRKRSVSPILGISTVIVAVTSIITSIPIAHHLINQPSSFEDNHMIVRIVHRGQCRSQAHGKTTICGVAYIVWFLRPLTWQNQIRRPSRGKKESNEATFTPDACAHRTTRAAAHSSCKLAIESYVKGMKIGLKTVKKVSLIPSNSLVNATT